MATCRFPSTFTDVEEARNHFEAKLKSSQSTKESVSPLAELLTAEPRPFQVPDTSHSSTGENFDGQSSPDSFTPVHVTAEDSLKPLKESFEKINAQDKVQFIGELFKSIAKSQNVHVPEDFILLALKAMKQLKSSGRSNFVYGLCKGLGEQRKDGSDSLFPSKRVISGLFEHRVNFFTGLSNVSSL